MRDILSGPRINASGWIGDMSDSKGRIGYTTIGAIPMVQSMGVQRWATYRNIYMTNPWIYAGVNRLAHALGRMPINIYQDDADGFPVLAKPNATAGAPSAAQRLSTLLNSGYKGLQQGQQMSRKAMISGTLIDRIVYGNALWIFRRNSTGAIVGLRRVRWRDMYRVEPDKDGWPVAYWWRPWNGLYYGPMQITPVSECIHFGFGSDPEGIYGVSPIEAARHSIALYDALERHLKAFFGNSARTSGFVSLDMAIDKVRAEQIRDFIAEAYASPENAGKIIAAQGATWQETGKAPDQSSIIELIKLSREEAVTVLSLSPTDVGILDNAIKSNVKELREQFGRDSLGPWAVDFQDEWVAQLLSQQAGWRNLTPKFDLSSLLLPDLEALALIIKDIGPVLTPDEMRTDWLGKSPLRLPGLSDTPWTAPRTLPMAQFEKFAATAEKAAGIAPADDSELNPDGSEPSPPPVKRRP